MPPSGVASIPSTSSQSGTSTLQKPQVGALYRHNTTHNNFFGTELIRVEEVSENVVLWYSHDGKTIRGETRGAMPINRFQSECELLANAA